MGLGEVAIHPNSDEEVVDNGSSDEDDSGNNEVAVSGKDQDQFHESCRLPQTAWREAKIFQWSNTRAD